VPFREERVFSGPVTDAALSPDGRWMALRDGGGVTVRAVGGAWEHRFAGVRAWAFAPDGGTVFLGGKDAQIVRFSLGSGTETGRFGQAGESMVSLALADGGRLLAAGTAEGRIVVRDAQSGEVTAVHEVPGAVASLVGHAQQPAFAARVSGAGCYVVTGGGARLVWPAEDSGLARAFPQPAEEAVFFGADGLAVRGADREVHLVSGWSGPAPAVRSFAPEVPPVALRLDGQGSLFVGCRDGRVLCQRGETSWETVASAPPQADRLVDFLVTGRGAIGRVFASRSVNMAGIAGPAVQARAVSFAPLGAFGAGDWWGVVGTDGELATLPQTPWRVPGGAVERAVPGGPAAAASLARVGPGFALAVENEVVQWDPVTDRSVPWFSVTPPVRALAASPRGGLIAVADTKEFRVVDAAGETLAAAPLGAADGDVFQPPAVLWDPAARWCALLTPGGTPSPWALVDVAGRRAEIPALPADALIAVPGQAGVWVAQADGTVSGWNVPGFTRRAEFSRGHLVPGPETAPRAMAVPPGGNTVAVASFGGDLSVWDGRSVAGASDLGPVGFLGFWRDGLVAVNDLGIVRMMVIGPRLAVRHEWRLAPPDKGMVLLWAGSAGEDLLATVDRVNGLSLWDDRGRLLGRLAGPRIPGGDLLALRAGADPDAAWMVGFDGEKPMLLALALRPPDDTAALVRWADEVTGERLEPDGSRRTVP
jgi:hypothetical protein